MFLVLFSVYVDVKNYKCDVEGSTFVKAVDKFLREVRYHWGQAPCILVGTKQDMRGKVHENKRLLPFAFGEYVARETGCLAYIETSAKTKNGIDELKRAVLRGEHYFSHPRTKNKCILT